MTTQPATLGQVALSRTRHPWIVALDLSLTGTGVCRFDGSTITLSTKLRGCERLRWIRAQVMFHTLFADLVVIEGYSYGSKGAAVLNLGELGGVIRLAIFERKLPLVEIPPACLKRYATGRGNASKDDVLQAGVMRSGHTFIDNNACDAWWLHQMALAHYEPTSPLAVKVPAVHREGLRKVPWVELGGEQHE
ncbi:MAG: crossover junction endodeoxyribonuclease RuvC [Thermoleophilia bacterium]|nr:crossover junction endodeoxyribonuclease RuvC [Thermoleophilia bacterium]